MKYKDIQPYIEQKLISEQAHPDDLDVRIFNYTAKVQYDHAWDDITRQCRGLIMNVRTGEVLARPFPKFFNYQEHVQHGWPIPDEIPVITEKIDGSLAILLEVNGKPWIATRGSFTSDQALWATDWYRRNARGTVPKGKTLLWEIVYPANRIVVNYDFSGLVFLASIDIGTGVQTLDEDISSFGTVRVPRPVPVTDLATLAVMDEPNSEGFVLYYPNANVRMKIKFPEYVRLHRIITGVSEVSIWELLRTGEGIEALLEKVPDEFFSWVGSLYERFMNDFGHIEDEARKDFSMLSAEFPADRKSFALAAVKTKYPSVLFAMRDGKDYTAAVWRMVRPKGNAVYKIDLDL